MGIMVAAVADAAPAVIVVPAGPRRFSREAGEGLTGDIPGRSLFRPAWRHTMLNARRGPTA